MFININTLQAGTSITSIPDSCEATGSLLFYPDLTADEVMAEIRATIDRVTAGDYWLRDHPPLLDLPLDAGSAAPWVKEPVNMPFDHPGVLTISEVMRACLGSGPGRRDRPVRLRRQLLVPARAALPDLWPRRPELGHPRHQRVPPGRRPHRGNEDLRRRDHGLVWRGGVSDE